MAFIKNFLRKPLLAHPRFGDYTSVLPACIVKTPCFSKWTNKYFAVNPGKDIAFSEFIYCDPKVKNQCEQNEFDLLCTLSWISFISNSPYGTIDLQFVCMSLGFSKQDIDKNGAKKLLFKSINNLRNLRVLIKDYNLPWYLNIAIGGSFFDSLQITKNPDTGKAALAYKFSNSYVKELNRRPVFIPFKSLQTLFSQSRRPALSRQLFCYLCAWSKSEGKFSVNGAALAHRMGGLRISNKQRIATISSKNMVGTSIEELNSIGVCSIKPSPDVNKFGPLKWIGEIFSSELMNSEYCKNLIKPDASIDQCIVPQPFYGDEAIVKFLDVLDQLHPPIHKINVNMVHKNDKVDKSIKLKTIPLNELANFCQSCRQPDISGITNLPDNLLQVDDVSPIAVESILNRSARDIPLPLFVLFSSEKNRQLIFLCEKTPTHEFKAALLNGIKLLDTLSKPCPNYSPHGSMRLPGTLNCKYMPPQEVGIFPIDDPDLIDEDIIEKVILLYNKFNSSQSNAIPKGQIFTRSTKILRNIPRSVLAVQPSSDYQPQSITDHPWPAFDHTLSDTSGEDLRITLRFIGGGGIQNPQHLYDLAAWLYTHSGKVQKHKLKYETAWNYSTTTVWKAYLTVCSNNPVK